MQPTSRKMRVGGKHPSRPSWIQLDVTEMQQGYYLNFLFHPVSNFNTF
jgi:hypothetical protein